MGNYWKVDGGEVMEIGMLKKKIAMIQEQHDESVIGGDSKVKFHKGEFTNSNLTIVILLIRALSKHQKRSLIRFFNT